MTLKEQIMKLQTYKMYEGEDTVYVERDDVLKTLEQQPCDDCVSKQAVLKIFDEACYIDGDWYVMREKIEKLPSITPSYNSIKSELEQTRPKGKWKILDECANEGVYCSKCHKTVFKLDFSHTMKWRNFKYCPNCGAKMEVEE